ncbi:hypothetical protein NECAME_17747, partial [Necator americanus]
VTKINSLTKDEDKVISKWLNDNSFENCTADFDRGIHTVSTGLSQSTVPKMALMMFLMSSHSHFDGYGQVALALS